MEPRYFCSILTQFAKCRWGKGLNGATCIMAAAGPKHGNQYPNFVSLYEGQDTLLHYCIIRYMLPGCMSIELSKQYTMAADRRGATESVITAHDQVSFQTGPPQRRGYRDTRNINRENASVAVAYLSQSRWFIIAIYTCASYGNNNIDKIHKLI